MFRLGFLLAPLLLVGAMPAPAETSVLLVTHQEHMTAANLPACAISLGSYGSVAGSDHIYLTSESCLESHFDTVMAEFQEGSMVPLETKAKRLFWLGEAGWEAMMDFAGRGSSLEGVFEGIQDKLDSMIKSKIATQSGPQKVLAAIKGDATPSPEVERLYQGYHSLVFSASEDIVPILDTLVPGHLSLVRRLA
jgi:hypothetical protein